MRERLEGSRTRRIVVEKEDGCETREAMIDRDRLLLATSLTFSFKVFYRYRTTTTTPLHKIRGFSHLPRKQRFSFRRTNRRKDEEGKTLLFFPVSFSSRVRLVSLPKSSSLGSRVSNEGDGGENEGL